MIDLIEAERAAFLDHLAEMKPWEHDKLNDLERHIRNGGTLKIYIAAWKRERDLRAMEGKPTPELLDQVLAAEVEPYGTVRDYLTQLLAAFWAGKADQRYGMAGNSDWQYDVYDALCRDGLIPGWRDGYGMDREAEMKANTLLFAAMAHMTGGKAE